MAHLYVGFWTGADGQPNAAFVGTASDPTNVSTGPGHTQITLDGATILTSSFANVNAHDFVSALAEYGHLTTGTHVIRLVVDPFGEIAETDETNNVVEKTFHWPLSANVSITITSVTDAFTPVAGFHSVGFQICNHDTLATLQPGVVVAEVSGSTFGQAGQVFWTTPDLAPGECRELERRYTVCAVGEYTTTLSYWGGAPDETPNDNRAIARGHVLAPAPVGVGGVCTPY